MAFDFYRSIGNDDALVHIAALGLDLAVRLPPGHTGQALTVIETRNVPGFGPPLHRHHETEIFRVLEGRYLYEIDGKRFEANQGDLVSIPGGAAHAFVNLSSEPSRQLIMIVPGMDALRFFTGLGDLLAAGRPTPQALSAFGQPWGVEFLGPPLTQGSTAASSQVPVPPLSAS